MIRKKATEYSFGPMAGNMMENGKMGNKTELVFTHQLLARLRKENGPKARENSG
jgi:hypothetical protein